MSQNIKLGSNKTGLQMSPMNAAELLEKSRAPREVPFGMPSINDFKKDRIQEASSIGSVPMPGNLKGMAKTGMQKVSGRNPEVLIDKLGARLAFERTGTRLYEGLLAKCEANGVQGDMVTELRRFQQEEAQHFALLHEAMEELGGDPTAVTPSADVDGVASMGLAQVISDPRTSVMHSLHMIHIAELADHDGWESLIALAKEFGQDDMAARFQKAFDEEVIHLESVRRWMKEMVMDEAGKTTTH